MNKETTIVASLNGGIKPGDNLEFRRSEICTDLSAAHVFTDMWGPVVRWVPQWGWLRFDGTRWRRDDEGKIRECAMGVGKHFRDMAFRVHEQKEPSEFVRQILSFSRKCESKRGMTDFISLAEPGLAARVDEFDREPYLVNFRNCTLDFEHLEGALPRHRAHCDADLLTKLIPYDWNMGAVCPVWQSFLEDILPDAEVREFVKRAVGYSILGTTREQVFFIACGTGCNGKSMFLNTLLTVLGTDYALQADPKTFMVSRDDGIRNDLADLRGVRFVSAIETGDGHRLDEGVVKQVTGGDMVRARHLYKEAFQYKPEFTLWFGTNHKPQIRGTDHAIWRRVMLIPFNVTISDEQRDPDLESKLLKEAEGILNWCVGGCVEYLRDGLRPPEGVRKATKTYRDEEDLIGDFLSECCEESSHAMVGAKELCEAFMEFSGIRISQTKFGRQLSERGYDRVTLRRKTNYIGLRLGSDDGCDS